MPPYTIDCHRPACHESSKVKSTCHMPTFASQLTDDLSLSTWCTIHRPRPSTRPISLDHRLRSVSPPSLEYGLQVHLQSCSISASQCISKLARLRPSCSHDHGLQVHLQTRSIVASNCISKLTRLRPTSLHDHGRLVHLETRSIMASECILS